MTESRRNILDGVDIITHTLNKRLHKNEAVTRVTLIMNKHLILNHSNILFTYVMSVSYYPNLSKVSFFIMIAVSSCRCFMINDLFGVLTRHQFSFPLSSAHSFGSNVFLSTVFSEASSLVPLSRLMSDARLNP